MFRITQDTFVVAASEQSSLFINRFLFKPIVGFCCRYSGGRSSLNEDPLEDVNTSESHPDEVKVNIDDDIIPVSV